MIEQIPSNIMDFNTQESLDFNFTLATFEQTICRNFQKIQQMLSFHHESINQLKVNNSCIKATENIQNKQTDNTLFKDGGLSQQTNINGQRSFTDKQAFLKLKPIQTPNIQSSQLSKDQQIEIILQNQQNQTKNPSKDTNNHSPSYLNQESKTNVDPISSIQLESGLIESKIFELFERVRILEQKQTLGSRQNNKHFRQLQFQIQETGKAIEKNISLQKEFNEQVQKLRNDLSQYKLKKQSKINKILHSSSLTQSNTTNNQTMDYITDKIQFLLKNIKEMLPKKVFEQERGLLHNSMDIIRRKLNQTINQTFFNESIKSTQVRIYQTVAKYIKAHKMLKNTQNTENEVSSSADNNDQLDGIISEGNKQFNERVNGHQQRIKQLVEKLEGINLELELERKERLSVQLEWNQQFKLLNDGQQILDQKVIQSGKAHQSLKLNFTQKYVESEAQIIQIQESVEKINSQLKTFNFVRNELTSTFTSVRNYAQKNESSIVDGNCTLNDLLRQQQKISINPEIEQDMATQKKKINKMYSKLQSYKQDLLSVREDFTREFQSVKMNLEKKADWDSLKKALNYFDEKMKEVKLVMQQVYQLSNKTDGGQSLAVKKGWTCLMCDRDIKNYEGKLSEVKFTNIFPNRDASPRIGGYYKQQQTSLQYKQVFMNNPGYNRAKRIGSLRSNQTNPSKEDLQS